MIKLTICKIMTTYKMNQLFVQQGELANGFELWVNATPDLSKGSTLS